MEIYKDINNSETKEFANLLNNQSKNKVEEGKIFEATVTKFPQNIAGYILMDLKASQQ